jgi:hypothetical protein
MQKYEPKRWRTDIIVFMNKNQYDSLGNNVFNELNCTVDNIRKSKIDKPMCTVRNFIDIKDREIPFYNKDELDRITPEEIYSFLYKNVDVLNDSPENLW